MILKQEKTFKPVVLILESRKEAAAFIKLIDTLDEKKFDGEERELLVNLSDQWSHNIENF